jgi:uncharacterized DUF497 family protein
MRESERKTSVSMGWISQMPWERSKTIWRITVEDRNHSEERFVTLGMDFIGRILVVAFTYRGLDTMRIISARKATKIERKQYGE